MLVHLVPRLLLVGCLFALMAAGAIQGSAAAKTTADPSNTISDENVMVQACNGFDITTSYTVIRTYHVVEYHTGHTVIERRHVSFAGSLGNAATGKVYAYDGQYTRLANFDQGESSFSDFQLWFEVGTPGMFSVSYPKVNFDLQDDPLSVVQAIVPNVLHMDLCYLFGGSTSRGIESMPPRSNSNLGSFLSCDPTRLEPTPGC
jgi:hypothetical protein